MARVLQVETDALYVFVNHADTKKMGLLCLVNPLNLIHSTVHLVHFRTLGHSK